MQSSLERYYEAEHKQNTDEPATLDQIRNGISEVLVKLDTLSIRDHPSQPILSQNFSSDISLIKSAQNLMELNHPEIVVDILEDGCRVTCMTCKEYFASDLQSKL